MNKKLLFAINIVFACLFLTECKSQSAKSVQIVFFDENDFNRTDTLLINNEDTVNKIKSLFSDMKEVDVKFPRKFQVTFIGKGFSEVFYTNGRFVRSNRKVYVLPDGIEFLLFESIVNKHFKKENY